jgi:hypothetical protein
MPYKIEKYDGFGLYARLFASGALCSSVTLAFTYPMEMAYTRMVADMTSKT